MAQVAEGEFKGSAILILKSSDEEKFPFQFGVRKAKLILSHLPDIERFVAKHDRAPSIARA